MSNYVSFAISHFAISLFVLYLFMSTAFIFPGQGSQYVGMGKDLYDKYPEVKDLYEQANSILGYDLAKVSFDGPEEELKQTYITQPAILVHSMACVSVLGDRVKASCSAGHSLGEFGAFIYSGALTFENGLKLVKVRSELMQRAGEQNKGTMAAVIGLDSSVLEKICNEASSVGIVQIANLNSPGQIVISGSVEGVKRAMELAKENKAKLVKELVVHGAFHSPLMASASEDFKKVLDETEFASPKIPVYVNVTGKAMTSSTSVEDIKQNLFKQLTSSVRWEDCVNNMITDGAKEFIELGPGKVLQGLVKRINNTVNIKGYDKSPDFESIN